MDDKEMGPIQEMDVSERTIHVVVRLPAGYMFVPDQHHYLNVSSSDRSVVGVPPFDLPDLAFDWEMPVTVLGEGRTVLHMEGQVFFCPARDATLCIYASIDDEWAVRVREGSDRHVELVHEVEVMEALDGALMLHTHASSGAGDA
jgi:hypothetical protein